ncbi:MAG: class I SAM-dependent methyltransferase [Saprospiraceae bacterium]|nr:class I SAM-dependent methyltransferase [Saprospiraceae bacterium]
MKASQDNFSKQALAYKKFRPTYPQGVYDELLRITGSLPRQRAWDCGTGNGQVAAELAEHYKEVMATDISQNQIDHAATAPNISYLVERAEQTSFPDNHFDLITVGQAMHWFDFEAFEREVRRVGRDGGVISIWGYGLLRINAEINAHIDHFYTEIIGSYWNIERRHIDKAYESIPFPYPAIPMREDLAIEVEWTRDQFEGYLNSWSSVQHYIRQHKESPVPDFIEKLVPIWSADQVQAIKFPIFIKSGKIQK